jgi:hypothetical protein
MFTNLLIVVAAGLLTPLALGFFPRVRLPAIVLEILLGDALGNSCRSGRYALVAGDLVLAVPLRDARGHISDLMVTAGSAADGIVLSGVAREMEQYLETLGAQASEAPRLHPVVPPESRPNTKVY